MTADGEGKESGTESGGSKSARQQQYGKDSEDGQGSEPGEKASSQIAGEGGNMGQGDSAEGFGNTMQKQAEQKHGNGGGRKGGARSSSELKNEIKDQMDGLFDQISVLQKEMGLDVSAGMESGGNLEEQSDLHNKENQNKRKELPREEKRGVDQKTALAGDKPGEKLYSAEPERIELPTNAENINMKIEGEQDELGSMRETVSTSKGKSSTKKRRKLLPTVGYDDTVERSKEQAEDDAIRKTSIPLEYEDIIKKIHTDKE
ncbi:aminomethyltransferase [Candidatus Scalindua japonica]|uniref:Aminomethyltransferase n=2 Tax=Candidatus Scalindua japonica TaxID=1284222 RepID=A0A286TXU4_9BACT|nr:aminomethyltransferase [Candidatus Scalindua japonica]